MLSATENKQVIQNQTEKQSTVFDNTIIEAINESTGFQIILCQLDANPTGHLMHVLWCGEIMDHVYLAMLTEEPAHGTWILLE